MIATEITRIGYSVIPAEPGHPDAFDNIYGPVFADREDAESWRWEWLGSVDRELRVTEVELASEDSYTHPDSLEWVRLAW